MKLLKQLTLMMLFAKAEEFKSIEIPVQREASATSTIDITNNLNSVYTGYLYFGGSKKNTDHTPEPLKIIFDSGSPMMFVQGTECDDKCTASKTMYDPSDSFYSHYLKKNGKDVPASVKYGSGTIQGVLFDDRVCLDDDADRCLEKFEMIQVNSSTGLE